MKNKLESITSYFYNEMKFDIHRVLCLIYLSDRLHLRKYCRTITRSEYIQEKEYVKPKYFNFDYGIYADDEQIEFNINLFSQSDTWCIEDVLATTVNMSTDELIKHCRIYPEYYHLPETNNKLEYDWNLMHLRKNVNMSLMFEPYQEDQLIVFNQSEELLKLSKELYLEKQAIENYYRFN